MFTLTIFIFTFKKQKTLIIVGLTNIDLQFIIERWNRDFGMWSLDYNKYINKYLEIFLKKFKK